MFTFKHVAILVKNMENSIQFYEQAFGLEVRFRKNGQIGQ